MKITKLGHACLVVKKGDRTLAIDPGVDVYTTSFIPTDNIDAVVITHEHSDHYDLSKILAICELNPDVRIFTTAKVASEIPNATTVKAGDKVTVGDFKLEFFGHNHTPVIDDIVPCDNIGVIVNDKLVYPGDSFDLPAMRPDILALPVSGPWLKVGEVVNYLTTAKPTKVFPTHEALLSRVGQEVAYDRFRHAADEVGAEFIELSTGDSLEI